MGKRGPKPGQGGRPRGGKNPPAVREYWRTMKEIQKTMVGTYEPKQQRRKKK